MKTRTNVSWKIDRLDAGTNERVNKWLNEQKNIQESLVIAVNTMIELMGYSDVSSYENRHKLHELLSVLNSDGPRASEVLNPVEEKKSLD